MTFADLRSLVRNEIIVDEYEDSFANEDIDDALWRASHEIAAAFDLPHAVTTVSGLASGATQFVAPAGCGKVHLVMIGGDDARPADLQDVLRMQQGASRPIRYFNFDPRRGGSIYIAPPSVGGDATVEYTKILTRPSAGAFDATAPWDGVLPDYHAIIAYRAGVALFYAEERQDEVQPWQAEYQNRAQEMAAYLGRTDMGSLMVQPGARNDEGADG